MSIQLLLNRAPIANSMDKCSSLMYLMQHEQKSLQTLHNRHVIYSNTHVAGAGIRSNLGQ